jgi:hypothetical protein
VKMSNGDLLDRLSIVLLKLEHAPNLDLMNEFTTLMREMLIHSESGDRFVMVSYFRQMYRINSDIWYLEADIRQGALDDNVLEVGKRAIKIREKNKLRVRLKNMINELTNSGFPEHKIQHLGE